MHTGFFANQGSVATIGSPSDSSSIGSGAGGKGSGAAGGDDSDLIVRPKKKKVCCAWLHVGRLRVLELVCEGQASSGTC